MTSGVTQRRLAKKLRSELVAGAVCGLLNGLFGSGGGVVAVMFLRSLIPDERRAHATATLAMLLMSLASLALYSAGGFLDLKDGLMFLPGGLLGALAGGSLLADMPAQKLRRLFGAVLCASGAVMLFS